MEKKFHFQVMEWESIKNKFSIRQVDGKNITILNAQFEKGCLVERHQHANEQVSYVLKGCLKGTVGENEYILKEGYAILIPPNISHDWEALEDTITLEVFSPTREKPQFND
ncbi:MAG: cupin domain-containing protein [Simkania sp.]|nr:cupin domain-containing protein [Simkania sp.]MCB1083436.1 cupin domain-containing protein [Simkania sp.]